MTWGVRSKREAKARAHFTEEEYLGETKRWLMKQHHAAVAKAKALAEAKAERRHELRLKQREGTNLLAKARIKACERHPSPFAVEQLVGIASNENLGAQVRVDAARLVLKLGQGA